MQDATELIEQLHKANSHHAFMLKEKKELQHKLDQHRAEQYLRHSKVQGTHYKAQAAVDLSTVVIDTRTALEQQEHLTHLAHNEVVRLTNLVRLHTKE